MDEDAREVAELSLRWDRAVQERDVSDVQDVLHEDYALVLVRPAKAVMTRAQWLALLPDYVVDEWNIREQVIDVDGDVAAVLQRVDMKATVAGQDRSGTFVTSDLWRRVNGGWKVWRRHSTPLSSGELPAGDRDHPHLDVLRRWFEAFERSDLETAREILASDAVLHVSKPSHLKGDYVGFVGFLDFYERRRAAAGPHFRYRVDELLAGDKSAAALLTLSRMMDDTLEEWKQIAFYRIGGEQILAMWFIEEEPG